MSNQIISFMSRIIELYSEGGMFEVWRGIRDFFIVLKKDLPWIIGSMSNEKEEISVNGTGVEIKTDTPVEYQRAKTLMGEQDVLENFTANIRPDDVVWDVGSNVGIFAMFSGKIAKKTVAIEPVPANVDALKENVEINNLSEETIIIEVALGSSAGTIDVPSTSVAGENHTLVDEINETEVITVPIRRADEIVASGKVPAPTVLKMDIEGAEADALDGFGNLLDQVRLVYIEVHGQRLSNLNRSINDVIELLYSVGLEPEALEGRCDDNYHIKAK